MDPSSLSVFIPEPSVFGSFITATFTLLVAPKLACVAIALGTDEYFSLMVRRKLPRQP